MSAYDFHKCKLCGCVAGEVLYRLPRRGHVYVCKVCRFHYIDYLDDLTTLDAIEITSGQERKCFDYIEAVLHSNSDRFESKIELLKAFVPLAGCRCLDVGAGGGLFVSLLEKEGAEAHGIEPAREYRSFARARFQLDLDPRVVEDRFWQSGYHGFFDVVTMWDVIEHVNFPVQTLDALLRVLKPAGILCLDTPVRDAFLYRAGEWIHRRSGGRLAALLEMQYSNQLFGHKQIFSSAQLSRHLEGRGLDILSMRKLHELSFPCSVYLQKLLRSRRAAAVTRPFAQLFFRLLPVRNKIVLVARKTAQR